MLKSRLPLKSCNASGQEETHMLQGVDWREGQTCAFLRHEESAVLACSLSKCFEIRAPLLGETIPLTETSLLSIHTLALKR